MGSTWTVELEGFLLNSHPNMVPNYEPATLAGTLHALEQLFDGAFSTGAQVVTSLVSQKGQWNSFNLCIHSVSPKPKHCKCYILDNSH